MLRTKSHRSEDRMATQDQTCSHRYNVITVKTSDGSTLQGKVCLAENQRVSDLFTQSTSPFIVMVDVTHREGEGKILVINKEHIIWVEPEDA